MNRCTYALRSFIYIKQDLGHWKSTKQIMHIYILVYYCILKGVGNWRLYWIYSIVIVTYILYIFTDHQQSIFQKSIRFLAGILVFGPFLVCNFPALFTDNFQLYNLFRGIFLCYTRTWYICRLHMSHHLKRVRMYLWVYRGTVCQKSFKIYYFLFRICTVNCSIALVRKNMSI